MPIEKSNVSLMDAKRLREERAPIVKEMKSILENAKSSGGLTGSAKDKWEKLDQGQRAKLELAQSIEAQCEIEGFYDDESIRQSLGSNGAGFTSPKWVADNQKGKRTKAMPMPNNQIMVTRDSASYLEQVWPKFSNDEKRIAENYGIGDVVRAIYGTGNHSHEMRAMLEGSGTGAYTVNAQLSAQVISYLLEESVAFKAGVGVLPLDQQAVSYKYTGIKTLPTVNWLAESASSTTYDFTLSQVTFAPKTCRTLVCVSRELLEDSVNISQCIQSAISAAFADALDTAILAYSTDSARPASIRNSTELSHVYAGGSTTLVTPKPVTFARGAEKLATQNVLVDRITGLILPTAIWGMYLREVDTLGNPIGMVDLLADLRNKIFPSNRINKCVLNLPSSDAYQGIMGDFSNVWVGMRKQLSILPINERYVDQNMIAFFAYLRADVQCMNYGTLTALDGYSTST